MVKHKFEAVANLDELEHEIQGIKEVIQHGGRPSYVIDHLRQMQKYLKNAEYHMGHLEKQQQAEEEKAVDPFEAFHRPEMNPNAVYSPEFSKALKVIERELFVRSITPKKKEEV